MLQIVIASVSKKSDPTYRLHVMVSPKQGEPLNYEIAEPFNRWFDETGLFVAVPFQEMLATAIPAIGKHDVKRVKTASQEMLDANPELLDAILSASGDASVAASTTTAAEPAEKKGGKRRKA
jgi:signal peptidase complex subunit 2